MKGIALAAVVMMALACTVDTTDSAGEPDGVASIQQEGLATDGFNLNGLNGWGNGLSVNGLSANSLNGLNTGSWLTLDHIEIDEDWFMCYCVEQSRQEERPIFAHICCSNPYATW